MGSQNNNTQEVRQKNTDKVILQDGELKIAVTVHTDEKENIQHQLDERQIINAYQKSPDFETFSEFKRAMKEEEGYTDEEIEDWREFFAMSPRKERAEIERNGKIFMFFRVHEKYNIDIKMGDNNES